MRTAGHPGQTPSSPFSFTKQLPHEWNFTYCSLLVHGSGQIWWLWGEGPSQLMTLGCVSQYLYCDCYWREEILWLGWKRLYLARLCLWAHCCLWSWSGQATGIWGAEVDRSVKAAFQTNQEWHHPLLLPIYLKFCQFFWVFGDKCTRVKLNHLISRSDRHGDILLKWIWNPIFSKKSFLIHSMSGYNGHIFLLIANSTPSSQIHSFLYV